jgi:hypothetical protein
MMVLDEPRTEDGELHFVALAECKYWKAIRGVTFLEEMRFLVIYKNWNNVEVMPGALVEVRGNLHIRGGRDRIIKAKLLRV